MQVLHIEKSLLSQMQIILGNKKASFAAHSSKLEALNPLSIVTRGYSVAYSNGKILKKIGDVKIDSEISVKLSDGSVNAKVVKKVKQEVK
jgi:exodeoxyribonuclease VII large subunit